MINGLRRALHKSIDVLGQPDGRASSPVKLREDLIFLNDFPNLGRIETSRVIIRICFLLKRNVDNEQVGASIHD